MNAKSESLPPLPKFSTEQQEACRQSGSAMPLMFEWYKHAGLITIKIASIDKAQPELRDISSVHADVVKGLLGRCARLMLSTLKLAHDGKCGETVALLARCIGESAITLRWLCATNTDEAFARYISSGLRTDLHLKDVVNRNIRKRGGPAWRIENRMLRSIGRGFAAAEISEADVCKARRLPNLESMCRSLVHVQFYFVE